jgi:hypothetical protein
MPKPKKTAFFIYCTERLQHFLNRSRDLLRPAIPEKGEAISEQSDDNLTQPCVYEIKNELPAGVHFD